MARSETSSLVDYPGLAMYRGRVRRARRVVLMTDIPSGLYDLLQYGNLWIGAFPVLYLYTSFDIVGSMILTWVMTSLLFAMWLYIRDQR